MYILMVCINQHIQEYITTVDISGGFWQSKCPPCFSTRILLLILTLIIKCNSCRSLRQKKKSRTWCLPWKPSLQTPPSDRSFAGTWRRGARTDGFWLSHGQVDGHELSRTKNWRCTANNHRVHYLNGFEDEHGLQQTANFTPSNHRVDDFNGFEDKHGLQQMTNDCLLELITELIVSTALRTDMDDLVPLWRKELRSGKREGGLPNNRSVWGQHTMLKFDQNSLGMDYSFPSSALVTWMDCATSTGISTGIIHPQTHPVLDFIC